MARDLRLNGANQPGPREEAAELPATSRITRQTETNHGSGSEP
jgi:hypothetical protein